MLVQLGADNAELTGGICVAGTKIHLSGNEVKVDPGAVLSRQDPLSPENHAVSAQIQFLQSIPHKVHGELLMGLGAPGGKDFVRMVMVVVMIMAAAGAVLIVALVMMVVFVVVIVVVIVVVMLVLMIVVVIVTAAGAMLIVGLVVMVLGCLHLGNDLGNGGTAFHGLLQLFTGQLSPGGSHFG